MKIVAGFECGYLPWNGHDLLHTTKHTPHTNMLRHYEIAKAHGITMARDGVSPDHDITERFAIARAAGIDVIWDLLHYHTLGPRSAFGWGMQVAKAWQAINGDKPFLFCPQNEPSLAPLMMGKSPEDAAKEGRKIINGVHSIIPAAVPFHVDVPFAPDWFGSAIIGVNIYPHTLTAPIRDVIKDAQDRIGGLVWVSETSWHDGYHVWDNIKTKGEWLDYVATEVEKEGVRNICWYPFVDCPPWDDPHLPERWPHGLIREDLTVDESLSSWIKKSIPTPS
jgi:hypothetical protein